MSLRLCFDIGNTDIYGGVFRGEELIAEFRKSNQTRPTVDEFAVFLVQLLRLKGVDPADIDAVAVASVVPDAISPVSGAVRVHLGIEPLVLQAGVRTGLKLRVKEPSEVGADRIANAIAAVDRFPGRDLIIVDTGTATTLCVVTAAREYLGGAIVAGLGLSMRALGRGTAKLPLVDIRQPANALGRTTIENIQSGLFFGHLGTLRELIARLAEEAYAGVHPMVVGTGGFAPLYEDFGIFDRIVPDLVLRGLLRAIDLNNEFPRSGAAKGIRL